MFVDADHGAPGVPGVPGDMDAGGRAPAAPGDMDAHARRGTAALTTKTTPRARILRAVIEVVAERGFASTTVKQVTVRAGVSSRTFYGEFDGLEDCFAAVIDMGLEQGAAAIAQAYEGQESWEDATIAVLASMLRFFDSEPLLTRMWFVEAMAAGSWAQERRERHVARLREMVLAWWAGLGNESPDPATTAGVMASVLGLIQMHVLTGEPGPLIDLLGPMMGLITAPYLGVAGSEREARRGAARAREIRADDYRWSPPVRPQPKTSEPGGARNDAGGQREAGADRGAGADHGADRARNPGDTAAEPYTDTPSLSAQRARECLLFVAAQVARGFTPTNREVAAGTGIAHESQVSRLLSDLRRDGLVEKHSEGVGKTNAWRLTPNGEKVAGGLSERAGEGEGEGEVPYFDTR